MLMLGSRGGKKPFSCKCLRTAGFQTLDSMQQLNALSCNFLQRKRHDLYEWMIRIYLPESDFTAFNIIHGTDGIHGDGSDLGLGIKPLDRGYDLPYPPGPLLGMAMMTSMLSILILVMNSLNLRVLPAACPATYQAFNTFGLSRSVREVYGTV
jgi:hypothetical protein